MKKILILFCAMAVAGIIKAQDADKQPPKVELSKEEKAKLKAVKEKEEEESYKAAGLTEDEITKVKAVNADYQLKSKELSKTSLTDDEKSAKKKELSDARKQQIIAIIGAEKYKAWQDVKKKMAKDKPQGTN